MRHSENHISDHDLLRSADGELPARQAEEIESHLTACCTCRGRKAQMETAIADFVNLHHNRLDAMLPSTNSARANLKRQMAELSHEATPRQRWLLFLSIPNRFQFAFACAILGLLALATVILQVRKIKYGHGSALAGMEARAVPDSRLTPGATLPVTSKDVCAAGAVNTVRVVPEPVARRVFASYGIYEPQPRAYELDYLITPALGGGDDIRNFWPQPYGAPVWNAHVKDALEDHLHRMVCEGKLDLATAQRDISKNWIAAYKKYLNRDKPLSQHSTFLKDRPWE